MSDVSRLEDKIYNGIRIVRHLCTAASVLIAVPAVIVIILYSNRISKRYASLLLTIEFLVVALDIFRELILDLIAFAPITCAARDNPLIPIPGSTSLYAGIWTAMVTLSIWLFFVCFLERHQAVQLPGSRWLFSVGIRLAMILLFFAIAISYPLLLKRVENSEGNDEMLQSIKKLWPSFPVDRAVCFDYAAFLCLAIYTIFGAAFGATCITTLAWHTLSSLNSSAKMSANMKQLNLSLTRVLIIQVLAPVALILLPLSGFMAAVFFFAVEGRLPLSICYLFMSFHPIAHSLILLLCTPMYRRKLDQIWKKINVKRFVEATPINTSATWT